MTTSDVALPRYKRVLYGGGVEELDRFGVRDAIRAGEITAESELALANSDEWRPAGAFPEFKRYLELAAVTPVAPVAARPAVPRDVQSMTSRAIHGLLYPLVGGEVIALIGLSVLNIFPFINLLARLASTVIMVEIVRTSAEGRTKMPFVDTTEPWKLMRTYVRVMFVTLVSMIPFFVVVALAVPSIATRSNAAMILPALALALVVALIYYPACLATIAVWDNVLSSLNPMYVMRVIKTIGADYFIVVGLWFITTFFAWAASKPALSPLAGVPFVGPVLAAAISYWALFYVSHLLGYAVYRHAPELGWE